MNKEKQHIAPPLLAERLLQWFMKDDLLEEVLGDLDEKFYANLKYNSKGKARRNYWYQVFNYLRPFAFKFFKFKHSNNSIMLKHFLIIFIRNFKRYKSASLINLFGLSVGLASTLLIYLWVNDELNMDKFNAPDFVTVFWQQPTNCVQVSRRARHRRVQAPT